MAGRVATCADEIDDAAVCDAVCDRERLEALARTGLSDVSDPEMEFFACWVREALEVPTAMVSLVQADRQVFPGAAGLEPSLQRSRSTPLSGSLCKFVVATAQPLTIPDVREDPRSRENPVFPQLGIIAYAGTPLTDRNGTVLGSLCAIDQVPRQWSPEDVAALGRIARACTTELRLRLADHDTHREEGLRTTAELGRRRAYERSQELLGASQAFMETVTQADVRVKLGELLTAALEPARLDVVILDGGRRLHQLEPAEPADGTSAGTGPGSPAATAIAQGRILHYPDPDAFESAHPGAPTDRLHRLGLHAVVAAPLPAADGPVGAVVLGWTRPHTLDPTDLLTVATIGGYAGQALGRARRLSHHVGVAHEMQAAMLTTLPKVPGLPMAARYEPADSRETVGGDWYDATPLPDPDRPGEDVLMLSVGDIVGHSLHAVTIMGQVRSMLRQSASDHPGGPPSMILDSFEAANTQFDLGAAGTAIVTRLRRSPGAGWTVTWTNAGHPPPILVGPDGTAELLEAHDPLFGFGLTGPGGRADHERDLVPGSLFFLYTDGLVERRDSDLDAGTARLVELLGTVHDREPQAIVDAAMDELAPGARDDVVAFAIRVPAG